nr:MAG TPA: hypothetical protein [Caudoviricetes sp.]
MYIKPMFLWGFFIPVYQKKTIIYYFCSNNK